ncbi:response regulator transcription factor, partial [Nocardia farcinica]|uniref:response regulator transcription factor n=1 Tax=Nocardia farcinica TaxID=37329 RepID=UPI00245638F8
ANCRNCAREWSAPRAGTAATTNKRARGAEVAMSEEPYNLDDSAPPRAPPPPRRPGGGAARRRFAALTPREQEILRLVGRGWSNAEIAADLHLAPGTVKVHVSSILRTTGARNRVEAALVAVHADALDTPGDPPHRNR